MYRKKIKVLTLEYENSEHFKYQLYHYYKRIGNIFNRSGIYYDRINKLCWIETSYGAFECNITYFQDTLEQLNAWERPLSDRVYKNLKSLHKEKFLFGKILNIFLAERDRRNFRKEFLKARKIIFKICPTLRQKPANLFQQFYF